MSSIVKGNIANISPLRAFDNGEAMVTLTIIDNHRSKGETGDRHGQPVPYIKARGTDIGLSSATSHCPAEHPSTAVVRCGDRPPGPRQPPTRHRRPEELARKHKTGTGNLL
ncbi:hypothetical protein FOS14_22100 [Skermania sp. ID1734]|uniref:hypothetical protein n=1 Tax=Skermania sp. ID1734 TaxID=2597516 RepID=UPI00117FF0C3|nr:hypothetical protein [Skermania sp. ID1734]TSD93757.1 hypothetical protein FOS14_22100 [Skermania sp. ID1734]